MVISGQRVTPPPPEGVSLLGIDVSECKAAEYSMALCKLPNADYVDLLCADN